MIVVSPEFSFSLSDFYVSFSFPFHNLCLSFLLSILCYPSHLTVVSVGNGVLVVWRKHEILHNAFNARDDLASQVRGRQVPRDELVRNADDVAQVVRQSESEHGELVAFEGVLSLRRG